MRPLNRISKIKQQTLKGRIFGIAAAFIIIVGGLTFAALMSQSKLSGNTIQTATANLQISLDGNNYGSAQAGFNFTNIVPGGAAIPVNGHAFFLKNSGGTPLVLKFAVTSTPTNLDNVDLTKVNVLLTPNGGTPQSFTLQSLINSAGTGGTLVNPPSQLFAGNHYLFTIQVSMASDAINSSSANLGNIDFAFNGIAAN